MLWGDNKEVPKANEKEWRTHIPIEKCLLECAERWDTKLVKGAGLSREKAMLKSGSQKGTKAGDDIWTDVLTEIAVSKSLIPRCHTLLEPRDGRGGMRGMANLL